MHHRLSDPAHDRLGLNRMDPEFLAEAWTADRSRFLLLRGSHFELVDGQPHWRPTSAAPPGESVLLGERDGKLWWALLAPADEPGETAWVTLRGALLELAAVGGADWESVALVLHAVGIAEWRMTTRFCASCAGELAPRAAGHELVCARCAKLHFPRTDPAVIMAITYGEPGTPEELLLLGRQASWPERRFSTLAGFCEPGESLEHAVRREVAEEVGVQVGEVSYFSNQAWPMPASLMLGFTGRALSTELVADEREISEARWVTRAELLAQIEGGQLRLPTPFSIARSLIENWYGDRLPGTW